MHIEVYDGNLSPSKELDQSVVRATDLFHRHHLDISAPVSVIAHNSPQPGVLALYHGLYTVSDTPTHIISIKQLRPVFSFNDSTPFLVHELAHAVQAQNLGQKPKRHNPLLGTTGTAFVQHRIWVRDSQQQRRELTLADVATEGVAKFAERTYVRELKGTIFNRLSRHISSSRQHDSVKAAINAIYRSPDMPLETNSDNIDEYAIGYRMMRRLEKTWLENNNSKYLLKAMLQINLNEINNVPVLARKGGFNPEFLHYYYHPEELPFAPLRNKPSAST